jgi:hypothetical protein
MSSMRLGMFVEFTRADRLPEHIFQRTSRSGPGRPPRAEGLPHAAIRSSAFFYTNRTALLLNGRFNNLVYGSHASGAPDVFIDDAQWKWMWLNAERCYVVAANYTAPRFVKLVGEAALFLVAANGGKAVLPTIRRRTSRPP